MSYLGLYFISRGIDCSSRMDFPVEYGRMPHGTEIDNGGRKAPEKRQERLTNSERVSSETLRYVRCWLGVRSLSDQLSSGTLRCGVVGHWTGMAPSRNRRVMLVNSWVLRRAIDSWRIGIPAEVPESEIPCLRCRLCLCSCQVYPLLRASYEGSILVYQWLYLFRRSAFFSPTLRLTGMVVRRTTYEDLEEDAAAAALGALGPEGFSGGSVEGAAAPQEEVGVAAGEISGDVGDSGGGPQGLQDRLGQYGRILLVVAIIGFKVAEWWTRVDAQVNPWKAFLYCHGFVVG